MVSIHDRVDTYQHQQPSAGEGKADAGAGHPQGRFADRDPPDRARM